VIRSTCAVALTAIVLGACATAEALPGGAPSGLGGRSIKGGGAPDHVTAESRYGHGRVSGPVRSGHRGGHEVRMPGGTWIDCGRSCAETLRRETVDFWESRGGRNDPSDGPAYLRWTW
jgi:hypothetical protein